MENKQFKFPSPWQFGDFVAFGLLSVVCIACLIYGLSVGFEGEPSAVKQAPWLLLTVAIVGGLIYARVIQIRYKDLEGFVLVGAPTFGFMVHLGDYKPEGGAQAIMPDVYDALAGWSKVFGESKVRDALTGGYIWIWFKPGPVDGPLNSAPQKTKLAGFTIYNRIVVGYLDAQPVHNTAFEHELGHVIQGVVTGSWDEAEHHARAKANGLR